MTIKTNAIIFFSDAGGFCTYFRTKCPILIDVGTTFIAALENVQIQYNNGWNYFYLLGHKYCQWNDRQVKGLYKSFGNLILRKIN